MYETVGLWRPATAVPNAVPNIQAGHSASVRRDRDECTAPELTEGAADRGGGRFYSMLIAE